MIFSIFEYVIFWVIWQYILELRILQINGNWIAFRRFYFEVLILELLKPDKYKLKVNKGQGWWYCRKSESHCAGAITTKFGKVVKWKQQDAASLKTKEMFYRTTFVLQTFLIASKLHATWYNNIHRGGQTVQTSQQMLYDVVWKVMIVWPGPYHFFSLCNMGSSGIMVKKWFHPKNNLSQESLHGESICLGLQRRCSAICS